MGHYRDDSLMIIWNPNGPKIDGYRKKDIERTETAGI